MNAWKWIHEGIKLLRDKGLRNIPDWELNRKVRFELVHIFSRKMSGVSDVEARRFQDYWTLEMLKYLDEGTLDELKEIQSAAKSFEELLNDEEVVFFQKRLGLNNTAFEEKIYTQPPNLKLLQPDKPENKTFNSALTKVYRFSQRYRLSQELNMDIDKMVKVDADYGPLDWRTHQAQIIYWGMEKEQKKFKSGGVDFSPWMRDAMLSSFYNGRVVFSEKKDYFLRTQNLEMLPRIHAYFDFALSDLDYGTSAFKESRYNA